MAFHFPNQHIDTDGDNSGVTIQATGSQSQSHNHNDNHSGNHNGDVSTVQHGQILRIGNVSGAARAPVIQSSFSWPSYAAPATIHEPPTLVAVPEPSPSPLAEAKNDISAVSHAAAREDWSVSGDFSGTSTVAANSSGTSKPSDIAASNEYGIRLAELRRIRHLKGLQRENSRRTQFEADKCGGSKGRKRGSSQRRASSRSKSRAYGKSRRAEKYGSKLDD